MDRGFDYKVIFIPFSLIFDLATRIRNFLYSKKILKIYSPALKTIGIGNLSMGGSGKTPVAEYLIHLLLSYHHQVCYVSRGYKRKTKGFQIARNELNFRKIGDEAFQVFRKFQDITVIVSEKRQKALEYISRQKNPDEIVILDDVYQHRSLKCGIYLLLTPYHKPYFKDRIFPAGNLRESACFARNADIILITKCPENLSDDQQSAFLNFLKPLPHQSVFFTSLKYPPAYHAFTLSVLDSAMLPETDILLFTAIADSQPLEKYLLQKCKHLTSFTFADHQELNEKSILKVLETFKHLNNTKKLILTTEKDFSRIVGTETEKYFENLPFYIQPVEIEFINNTGKLFNEKILKYVDKNQ